MTLGSRKKEAALRFNCLHDSSQEWEGPEGELDPKLPGSVAHVSEATNGKQVCFQRRCGFPERSTREQHECSRHLCLRSPSPGAMTEGNGWLPALVTIHYQMSSALEALGVGAVHGSVGGRWCAALPL